MTIDKTKNYDFNVGENIRLWREFKNVKQEDLAKQIGKSKTTISNIERGKEKANTNLVEDISKALGILPYQLYSNTQHQFTFNNCPNCMGVNNGTQNVSSFDNKLLEKLITLLDKLSA